MPKPGHITPSQFGKIMTNDRSGKGFGKTAIAYADEVILGLLGVPLPEVHAPALEWGKTFEPKARKRYELMNFTEVPPVTEAIHHPEFSFVCGTPDGLVDDDGILEIKCPYNSLNHFANLKTGEQIEDYKWQIQGYLWITGRQWCDFVSYDERFDYDMQFCQYRVERDEELIKQLSERVFLFWDLVQSEYFKIKNR